MFGSLKGMVRQVLELASPVLKGSNADPQSLAERQLKAARASHLARQSGVTKLPSAASDPTVLRQQRVGPRNSRDVVPGSVNEPTGVPGRERTFTVEEGELSGMRIREPYISTEIQNHPGEVDNFGYDLINKQVR